MTRAIGLTTMWLGLWVLLTPLQGQQLPAPVLPTGAGDGQAQQPSPNDEPAPVVADPKTGLPLTPAEQREKEIDKYDPMKRGTDPGLQDTNPPTDRKQPAAVANPRDKSEPQPGSVAGSNPAPATSRQSGGGGSAASGPDSSADTSDTGGAEYTGPAVLSRSYTLARPMIPRQIKWEASVGINYSWDTGETPSIVDGKTSSLSTTIQSHSYNWSFSGRHIWKHDQVGLSYTGNYSAYGNSSLSGMNHSLNLDYGHVISRRLTFQLVESLQDLSQNYSLENPTLAPGSSIANINLATSPNVQLLTTATRQSSSSASMTFRQTSRLSYNLSTSYFLIGRSQGVGMSGRQVGADVNYRLTRKTTVGAYYSYTDYLYSHHISNSDSHGLGMIYSYAFNPRLQLRTRFGASRIESLGYAIVVLPPELAAILGQGAAIVNAYSDRWISDVSVELVRDFRRGRTASLAFVRGESPGNGVLLTSVQQNISAGYSMSLFRRRLPVNAGVIYSSLDATSQGNLGYYRSQTAYVGTSRPLGRKLSADFRFDYRRYDVSGSPLLQHDMRISVGLSWSPPPEALRFLNGH